MNKLPVFRVAGRAIGFTLWNSFTIFRLAWLPFTAMIVAQIGLTMLAGYSLGQIPSRLPNPLTMGLVLERVVALNITLTILQTIAIASVAVSIHRVILFGERRAGSFFNFAFGKTEFLYIVMGLLTAFLVLAALAVVFLPFILLVSSGDPAAMFKKFANDPETLFVSIDSATHTGWFAVFMTFYAVAYVLIIYLSLRLAVWPPSVVATNKLSPSEPWQLTRGNVWRFIGVFVLVVGFIYLIVLGPLAGASFWYYKTKMAPFAEGPTATAPVVPEVTPATPPTEVAPDDATKQQPPVPQGVPSAQEPVQPPASIPPMPVPPGAEKPMPPVPSPDNVRVQQFDALLGPFVAAIWIIFLLFFIYFTALTVAVMSFSYKALKGYEPHEPIPADG